MLFWIYGGQSAVITDKDRGGKVQTHLLMLVIVRSSPIRGLGNPFLRQPLCHSLRHPTIKSAKYLCLVFKGRICLQLGLFVLILVLVNMMAFF